MSAQAGPVTLCHDVPAAAVLPKMDLSLQSFVMPAQAGPVTSCHDVPAAAVLPKTDLNLQHPFV